MGSERSDIREHREERGRQVYNNSEGGSTHNPRTHESVSNHNKNC